MAEPYDYYYDAGDDEIEPIDHEEIIGMGRIAKDIVNKSYPHRLPESWRKPSAGPAKAAQDNISALERVKQELGPVLGRTKREWPSSSNYRDRLTKIYEMCKELQDDFARLV